MSRFFTNKRLIILLSSVIIFVGLIGFSLANHEKVTTGESFIKDTVGWMQGIFSKPAQWVQSMIDTVDQFKNLYEENKRLKAQLESYVSDQVLLRDLKEENQKLSDILGIQEKRRDKEVIHATVIARNPDQWDQVIFINKGKMHGIEQDMAVITPEGLIGKISQVAEYTSKVQLLTSGDRTNRISALIQSEKLLYGVLEGDITQEGYLLLKHIPIDGKVQEGMNVSTSGLGGVFPKGLYIGTVVDAYTDEHGLTQTVTIKPAADFYRVQELIVVKRTMDVPEKILTDPEGGAS